MGMKYSSGPQVPTMPKDGSALGRGPQPRRRRATVLPICAQLWANPRVLTRVLPKKGIALEIGSGTGEHVICFAKALHKLTRRSGVLA